MCCNFVKSEFDSWRVMLNVILVVCENSWGGGGGTTYGMKSQVVPPVYGGTTVTPSKTLFSFSFLLNTGQNF